MCMWGEGGFQKGREMFKMTEKELPFYLREYAAIYSTIIIPKRTQKVPHGILGVNMSVISV